MVQQDKKELHKTRQLSAVENMQVNEQKIRPETAKVLSH